MNNSFSWLPFLLSLLDIFSSKVLFKLSKTEIQPFYSLSGALVLIEVCQITRSNNSLSDKTLSQRNIDISADRVTWRRSADRWRSRDWRAAKQLSESDLNIPRGRFKYRLILRSHQYSRTMRRADHRGAALAERCRLLLHLLNTPP